MNEPTADLESVAILGILSFLVLWIAKRKGFFTFPCLSWPSPILLIHVLSLFAIYFCVSTFITPILGGILRAVISEPYSSFLLLRYVSWINFINSTLLLLGMVLFCFLTPKELRRSIWIRPDLSSPHYGASFQTAGLAWLLSFPVVLFVNQLSDLLLSYFFQISLSAEQLAVQFLKMTFGFPLYLFLAILTIVIFAPIIEEILFRGFLQSWIRQHLGSRQAIFITSLLFAFFHYSPEQGMSNVTIVSSLFVFSLFIGFVYEKQGTLVTPMMLHSLFNTINVCNLYFFGGIFDRGIQVHL